MWCISSSHGQHVLVVWVHLVCALQHHPHHWFGRDGLRDAPVAWLAKRNLSEKHLGVGTPRENHSNRFNNNNSFNNDDDDDDNKRQQQQQKTTTTKDNNNNEADEREIFDCQCVKQMLNDKCATTSNQNKTLNSKSSKFNIPCCIWPAATRAHSRVPPRRRAGPRWVWWW